MDERRSKTRNDDCPRWCEGGHRHDDHPEDRWHRSATASVPAVLWGEPGAGAAPEPAILHVALVQPMAGGEVRVRLEADGRPPLDLDTSAAARLTEALAAVVALLVAAG